MGRELDRLRARTQQRMRGAKPQAVGQVTDVQVNYGITPEAIVLTFNVPIKLLALNPQQAQDLVDKVRECMAARAKLVATGVKP